MRTPITVLAILGEPSRFDSVIEWIRRRGQIVNIVTTGAEGLRVYQESGADLVLLGLPLPDLGAAAAMEGLRRQDPRATMVVVGKDADVDSALDAYDLGAQEYVANPIDGVNDLLFALGVSIGVRSSDVHFRFLKDKDAVGIGWRAVIGDSPAMQRVIATLRQLCRRTAQGSAPAVLLTGETGTGKGLIAKSIHYNSVRRSRPFVDINCATIPPQLLESELFGHEKGAFTDARSTRVGLFETADTGTLFLDEIGTLPVELQSKILTAIEDKQIRRVGGRATIKVDLQIIAATNRDLAAMVKRDQFRPDLYHRLNVIAVELPPLRERGDDALLLARTLLDALCAEYGIPAMGISDAAAEAIRAYAWPGNVRELRNELERIVLLSDEDVIDPDHFRFVTASADGEVAAEYGDAGLKVVVNGDRCPLDSLEREVIRQALGRCRGNVSRTARFLAITRQTLIYRMKKYGFASPSSPGYAVDFGGDAGEDLDEDER